jgi:DNA-binding response OmpR family regulator
LAETPKAAGRVLVIDDNDDAAESLRLILESEGHEVFVANDGESGLDIALRERPHFILVDIGLPRMDGHAVARALRARVETRDAEIIALTGYGSHDDVIKSREAGFDEHMTKPVDPRQLLRRIAQQSRKAT